MNKKIINRLCGLVIPVLALAAMTGQAKTYKTIMAPESMACVNVNGELKARQVIMADTATTVLFTMAFPKGQYFQFVSSSYLMDEDGNRYPLRSAEGLALDAWVQSPESGVTDFTIHFQPLPKKVQQFDFIEGDGKGAFMLLGIHDGQYKVKAPTLQELLDANPYTVPADWFTTDTITIRGRIEGYDAEKFGFTSMECYYQDVFEKDAATLVLDIAADGSFEKKFKASYPIQHGFTTNESKVGFNELPFYARPGETIDVTVRPNGQGQYECYYNSGSSKDVERWLKADLKAWELVYPLTTFKGKLSEVGEVEEYTWDNMLYRLQMENRRNHFTPQEMQLALAEQQVCFAQAVMDYAMYHEDALRQFVQRDGVYYTDILDSVEWNELGKAENYEVLHRIDFDNPLLLMSSSYPHALNRMQYNSPIRSRKYEGVAGEDGAIEMNTESDIKILNNCLEVRRKLLGSDHDNLMAQLCIYEDMLSNFDIWRSNEDALPSILADTALTVAEREEVKTSFSRLSNMMPTYLATFSHPYIHQKAEAFYAYKMAQKDLATPLPADNPSADLIRNLCAKYPGRFLVIDFWGMGCGPCRLAIQNSKALRAKVAKRDDVKFVFIAGERIPGGSDAYHKYVAEWLADEETVCLPDIDFTRLQEMFRFNGIPHYETITPDCRRVRDDLQIHGYYSFDFEFNRLMERLK